MRVLVISGSHRKDSNSEKVARFAEQSIKRQKLGEIDLLKLEGNPIPLWTQEAWSPDSELARQVAPYLERMEKSDAIVIVVPEWMGMVPAGVKNLFLFAGGKHLGHKPGLLVSVSSGIGGVYPIAEMRNSSYKNCRLNYIPDHLIVRDANNVLNPGDAVSDDDRRLRDRFDYTLRVLGEYSKGLKMVRESGVVDFETYPNGM